MATGHDVSGRSDEVSDSQGAKMYFCYVCSENVVPPASRGDLECPKCSGGFLEEVEDDNQESSNTMGDYHPGIHVDETPQFPLNAGADLVQVLMRGMFDSAFDLQNPDPLSRDGSSSSEDSASGRHNGAFSESGASGPNNDPQTPVNSANASEDASPQASMPGTYRGPSNFPMRGFPLPPPYMRGGPSEPYSRVFDGGADDDMPTEAPQLFNDDLIQALMDNILMHSPMNVLNLNGNPGDYAWGPQGLDTIVTQMLNQMESGGPPPCSRTTIDALPSIQITDTHVSDECDCSVCQEVFKLEEKVCILPCKHLFHKDCIKQWLSLHNACPVCRKPVSSDSSEQPPRPPQPPPRRPFNNANAYV